MVRSTNNHRPHKFAALDLRAGAIRRERDRLRGPLAVICAAVLTKGAKRPSLWYGVRPGQQGPAAYMSRNDARRLVYHLEDLVVGGHTLVTWNGAGFDWNMLATESGEFKLCRELAEHHVDMMFHVVCARGHRLSLGKAARGMGVARNVDGWDAEALWNQRRYDVALARLTRDVRVTLQIAERCQARGALDWTADSGRVACLSLPAGWLSVAEASQLPAPNVAGLSYPTCRSSVTGWMK